MKLLFGGAVGQSTRPETIRALWISWLVMVLLSMSASPIRQLTQIPGSGSWPIYVAVLVNIALWFWIRKSFNAFPIALCAGLAAISFGGVLGFATSALLTEKPFLWQFGGKWAIMAAGFHVMLIVSLRVSRTNRQFEIQISPSPIDEIMARYGCSTPEEFVELSESLEGEEKEKLRSECKAVFDQHMEHTDQLIREADILIKKSDRILKYAYAFIAFGILVLILAMYMRFK
jgi:hypothetical protein